MLLRKLTTALVEKLLTVKKGGKLEFETGAQIRVRAPNGGAVTATVDMTELGVLDGLTATAAELNRATDISARVVTTTATVLALTVTQHAERTVLVNTNSTVANTFTLPVATGSGAKFTVVNNIAQTQGSIVVAANGTLDTMKGIALVANTSTTVNAIAALTSATSDKVTWNRTTTGGAGPGDTFHAIDGAANVWTVSVVAGSVGDAATPFSQT
jgi:hypothetical protein